MKKELPEGWKNVNMYYDEKHKKLYIEAAKSDFYPAYLKYLLQAKGIPEDVKCVFTK